MNLKIFTTQRQIRKWLEDKDNQFLDKFMTLGEFLEKIVVVEGVKFVDKDFRKKYLYDAIKNTEVEKLGISREFLNFFEDSDFIFSFFNELFLEGVDIDKVIISDIYQDYEEHLLILKEILKNYKELLEKDGYIDKFLIEDFRINEGLLEGIEKIEIRLDGYLSRFDIEVLSKIDKDIEISFEVDRFNKELLEKSLKLNVKSGKYLLDFKSLNLTELQSRKNTPSIEVEAFSERINQVAFVFAKIKEFVESGVEPDKIAVILPDESFSEFLKAFDEKENLNFAMGESFTNSDIYIKLKAIYEYLSGDEEAVKKCGDVIDEFEKSGLIDFIKNHAGSKELKVIDEELFKLKTFEGMIENKRDFLYFVLERFKDLSFDDTYSGKITCMGVLESRGMEFEGVILIDFNDSAVPNVSDSDMFLNTHIRKLSNLPTRKDKENLQKHYYYQLINNAKKVAISYVENEENSPSRFLYELNLKPGEISDKKYQFFKRSKNKEITKYEDKLPINYPIYPTQLKTLLECPKRYYFQNVLKIRETGDEEFFGDIFHNAIKEITFGSADEYYKNLISKITSMISDKKLLFEVLVKWDDKIKEFCKIDYEFRQNYTKSVPEKTVDFIYEGVQLAARVDRIDENDSEIVLIDYKTSKNAGEKEKYIYEYQTTFYHLWASINHPQKKVKTYIWDLDNVKMVEGVFKDDLEDVLNNLPTQIKEAEDIKVEDKVIKKASQICEYCPYIVACGRDL